MSLSSARWILLLLVAAVGSGAIAWAVSAPSHDSSLHVLIVPNPPATPAPRAAYITGAVLHPGVYPIAAGARLADLVAVAGGMLPDADTRQLNLATRVADGEHIDVPRLTGAPPRVRLNHASRAELLTLPAVTSQAAAAIQASIRKHGSIVSADDLASRHLLAPELIDRFSALVDWAP